MKKWNVAVNIDQYERFLRFEVRLRTKASDKNKNKVLFLSDLYSVLNQFKRLTFYKRSLDLSLHFHDWEEWRKNNQYTMVDIKDVINKYENTSRLKAKYEKYLKAAEVDLIDFDKLWTYWPDCVVQLGIFTNPIYWQENLREKWWKENKAKGSGNKPKK